MNYQPKVSVITPTFNRAYCLWKSIQSVLNQTYPFFELIVVDDASKDNTEKLIKEFSDPRIIYFKLKENKGPSSARNYALGKAKGEYVAYLDSDNAWYPEFLEVLVNGLDANEDKVIVFCKKNYRLNLVNKNGEKQAVRDEYSKSKKYFDLKRLWHRRIMIDTNSMCHRRQEIIDLGAWDEKLSFWEDWELTLRISDKYPNGFLYLNRTLLDYEQNIQLAEADKVFEFWEQEEEKVFNKHKDNPLLKGQSWFPPQKGNKSTLGVIEYLKNKHNNK